MLATTYKLGLLLTLLLVIGLASCGGGAALPGPGSPADIFPPLPQAQDDEGTSAENSPLAGELGGMQHQVGNAPQTLPPDAFAPGGVAGGLPTPELLADGSLPIAGPGGGPDPRAVKLQAMLDLLEKARQALNNANDKLNSNPLAEEAATYDAIGKLSELAEKFNQIAATPEVRQHFLDNSCEALKALLNGDSSKLKAMLSGGADNLKQGAELLDLADRLVVLLKQNGGLNSARRQQLAQLHQRLETAKNKLESLQAKAEAGQNYLGEAQAAIDQITRGLTLDADTLNRLFEDIQQFIQGAIQSKLEELGESVIKRQLARVVGSAGALALWSMANDAKHFIEALMAKQTLEEQRAFYNQTLLELIKYAAESKAMATSQFGQANPGQSSGIPDELNGCQIVLQPVLVYFCPKLSGKPGEGEWKELPCQISPSDSDKYKWTVSKTPGLDHVDYQVSIPGKSALQCTNCPGAYLLMKVTIMRDGKVIHSTQHFAGVLL